VKAAIATNGVTWVGMPAAKCSFAPWPFFESDEIEAVARVLQSGKVNYWTGEECRNFEQEYAASIGVKYAIALANGTVALELALRALNIGPGDEVVTTSRTFIASASCAVSVGARPVMADVDRDSQNMTADTIRAVLTPRTKAVVVVHLAGWPCDMDPILQLAQDHGLKIIEDCAQANGATYKDRPVGSMGDVAAFSFCQDKIITTGGEGGLLATNDETLWKAAWAYKEHGKSYDAVHRHDHKPGFRWLHESFGTNWRMTEMQAAIGRVALRKLPNWVATRRQNAATLSEGFAEIPGLRVPVPGPSIGHSYYRFYAFVRPERLQPGWSRDRLMSEIRDAGIPCAVGSCSEIYQEKAFQNSGWEQSPKPVAKELGETSLMFLVHPTLAESSLQHCVDIVKTML
jgi:dTDP-4-amino-4,6-dideoxygalactose transaminase